MTMTMPIDIDTLSEADLIDLNRRVVERLRLMQQVRAHQAMLNFSVGERVKFHSRTGENVSGVITRYNRKTVTVITDDHRQWNVSPALLEREAVEGEVVRPGEADARAMERR